MKRVLLSTIFIIVSAMLFATDGYQVTYKQPTSGKHQLEFTLGEYTVTNVTLQGTQYSRINFEGKVVTQQKGYAELPYLNASVMLDPDKNVFIGIIPGEFEEISLDHPLVPSRGVIYRTQDPASIPYYIDPRSVTDSWYPVELAENTEPYIIRDVRGTTVYVYPFQYNAERQVLRVYKSITIRLGENNTPVINPLLKETSTIVREMEGIYQSIFINYGMNRDALTIGEFGDIYILLTARDEEAIQPYIDWKREKGYNVFTEVVPTGTVINSNVQAAYDANNNILYVLLVGDWADVKCTQSGSGRPMDPQVGTVVGNDDFADIAVGRFSANSPADVTVQVNKVITYERDPDMAGTWFSYATGMASAEGAGYGDDGEADAVHETVIWTDKLDPFTYTNYNQIYDPGAQASMVTSAVNAGTSVINYTGHGSMTSWGTTGYSNSNVATLTNGDMLPFIFSVACNNGDFDLGTCFAEAWLRKEGGGAIIFLGASISQPWQEPMRGQDYFNDVLIGGYNYDDHPGQNGINTNEQRTTIGSIIFNGLTLMCVESNGGADWETATTWNTFGDPSLQPRTATPLALTLTNELIMVGIPFITTVNSSAGPVANAMVTLSQDGNYFTGITDEAGSVTINHTLNPGNAKLVVTGFNTETIYENVSVIPPNGPFVTVASVEIDDSGANGNGQLDYNEEVYLTIGLTNVGTADAANVSATIASTDEFIDILVSAADFGTIAVGDTVFVTETYSVGALINIPDMHLAVFDLAATNGTRDTWVSSFTLTGHAPVLEFTGYTLDDSANGNGNGRLDPGESLSVTITASNTGSSDVTEVSGALSCTNSNITVNNSPLDYGDLAAGESNPQVFEITVSTSAPTGESAMFSFDMESLLGITGHGEFVEYVGQIPVLLIDWDANHNSPDVLEQCFNNLEVEYDRVTSFPADINIYASVFVCLGTYSDNHVLTADEGQLLADYLNQGGNLFMEGADTWYYDPQFTPTPVHDMFNITGLEDGGSDLTVLEGQAGTITEGMMYTFNGDNNYIDHIGPIAPAQVMFMNTAPAFGAAVSYDAGTYKTIGFSFEFGGLVDGDKNKDDLMIQILDFFDIQGVWTNVEENVPLPLLTSGCYPNPFSQQTVISFETDRQGMVTVDIFDMNGRIVNRILDADLNSGPHQVSWDGKESNGISAASGMYFYNVKSINGQVTGKLMKIE